MVNFRPDRIIALISGLFVLLSNNHACALSLMEAYDSALKHDSVYLSAISEHQAGQEYVTIGRSNLLPNVSANYTYNKNQTDITTSTPTGRRNEDRDYSSETMSIQARQPIINLESWAKYRQGTAQTSLSDKTFAARSQDLISRLFGLYAQADFAESVLALVTAQRDAYKEQYESNKFMAKRGEGTKTDEVESQAKLDLAEAQLIEAQDNLINERNALSVMIGSAVGHLDKLSENFKVHPMQPATLEEWKNLALEHNPEIAAKRDEVEIAAQEVKRNQSGHYPRLDAIASIGKSDSDSIPTYKQKLDTQSIGLQLSIPIYSGNLVSALTAQSNANHEKAQRDLETKTNEILLDLQKQYSLALSSEHRIDALVQSVVSAELLVTATQKSVLGGVRTNLDVLNAKKQLTEAKRDLALARFKYLVSYINLRKAAGILTVADLEAVASNFSKQP